VAEFSPLNTGNADAADSIVVEHLSKVFRQRHEHHTLKRTLTDWMRRSTLEYFTALDDLSFRVPHGQTLAVIGRNGSGKSTLLSLLARVLRPTSGSLQMSGLQGGRPRIAPLLELGAGLHPELDGYDNIAFYGAMLGMTARQVRDRTDSIIHFAELEKKADTIVRNWNDGARLRLGFSIAVHIDPDILLVDEVLAVGDEAFQNKCYRKIAELKANQATIVFVSHDLPVVERVADRVLWLDNSRLRMDGDVTEVLRAYRRESAQPSDEEAGS
jgi:ABC-type polysaccharide/polyol phosphate transport system ATPase subunit